MSITVRKLAQECLRLETGGPVSDQSPWSEQYIMLLVRQAANSFLLPMVLDNMANDDRSTLHLLVVGYEVDVVGEFDHRYLTLPDFYMRMPFNKGLKGIAPIEEPDNEFIPRHNAAVSHNLPCGDAEQQDTYWTEGMRVYFDKPIELGKLLVKLVVAAPDSVLDDDVLPIYAEMQAPIIAAVRQMMANRPILDKTLDGNPDLGIRLPA